MHTIAHDAAPAAYVRVMAVTAAQYALNTQRAPVHRRLTESPIVATEAIRFMFDTAPPVVLAESPAAFRSAQATMPCITADPAAIGMLPAAPTLTVTNRSMFQPSTRSAPVGNVIV